MKLPEMIVVKYVLDEIVTGHGKEEGKYLTQFSGLSDNPRKLMQLQTWRIPHGTAAEAEKMRDEIRKAGIIYVRGNKGA